MPGQSSDQLSWVCHGYVKTVAGGCCLCDAGAVGGAPMAYAVDGEDRRARAGRRRHWHNSLGGEF